MSMSPTMIASPAMTAAIVSSNARRSREEEEANQEVINAVEGVKGIKVKDYVQFECSCGAEYKVAVLVKPDTELGAIKKDPGFGFGVLLVLAIVVCMGIGFLIGRLSSD